VQHQMFDAVVYWKALSLARQLIAAILIKLCGGGTTKSKSPFHDDLPIFVPLSQDRFKDGTDEVNSKNCFFATLSKLEERFYCFIFYP
jgi:hypothetical protein